VSDWHPDWPEWLKRGHRAELTVAARLLPLGLWIKVDPLEVNPAAWRETTLPGDPLVQYLNQADIAIEGGHCLEVKGRRLRFTSPADYPYPTAYVGKTRRWEARKHLPCSVVLVSEITGEAIVVPVCTRTSWIRETPKADRLQGYVTESFAAPRSALRGWETLLLHLSKPCPGVPA
jgi:hypothetical protein